MKKNKQRYFIPAGWSFGKNHLVGFEWQVNGSKLETVYTITVTKDGFMCSCTGFQFHGKCKHIIQIVERFE